MAGDFDFQHIVLLVLLNRQAVMLGAIFMVHLPHGFNVADGGAEYALTQLLVAMAFLLTGPGAYSLGSFLPAAAQNL